MDLKIVPIEPGIGIAARMFLVAQLVVATVAAQSTATEMATRTSRNTSTVL